MRDESIWKNLALAFGDGLAFGAGVKLSHDAAERLTPARADLRTLAGRLNEIERRIDRARQNHTLPGQFNQKVVEAVVSVVDARLRDQAEHFEHRLTEEMGALRAEFNQQIAMARADAQAENQLVREQMTALHRQFAETLGRLVDEQIAATVDVRLGPVETRLRAEIRQQTGRAAEVAAAAVDDKIASLEIQLREEVSQQAGHAAGAAAAAVDEHVAGRMQPVENAVADLSHRLQENDRNTLELVLALGQLCLQTAERLSEPAVEMIAQAPVPAFEETAVETKVEETGAAETPATSEASSAAPKALWRIPLVSSFFLATGGLLLLHYL